MNNLKILMIGIFICAGLALAFLSQLKCQQVSDFSYLITSHEIGNFSKNDLIEKGFGAKKGVTVYHIIYHTTDLRGDITSASGVLIIPEGDNKKSYPLVSSQHGTNFQRYNVPSRMKEGFDDALYFACAGFITTAPDYLGLGDNPGLHPYIHSQTEATATIDLIRAAREFINTMDNVQLNGNVYLTGISLGGHATLAAIKYIEEHQLLDEFNIKASAPISGTYDLSQTTTNSVFIENNFYFPAPEIIANIIVIYQNIYGNLYENISDYFKVPYDSIMQSYIENDCSGSLILPENLRLFLKDSILNDMAENENHALRVDFMKNDVYDWAPKTSINLYYCKNDEMVNYKNSTLAYQYMTDKGAKNVKAVCLSDSLNHNNCQFPAMQETLKWFQSIEVNEH